jgi:hypothetical protein
VVGLFIAATVVTLVQFLRVRDRRMLLLAALFAFQSQALGREWHDVWRDVFQAAACGAGLGLLCVLSPRPHHAPHEAPHPTAPAIPSPGPVAPTVDPKA